jgi:hypothetical protein
MAKPLQKKFFFMNVLPTCFDGLSTENRLKHPVQVFYKLPKKNRRVTISFTHSSPPERNVQSFFLARHNIRPTGELYR